jgi:hypothetical protein
MYQRLLPVIRIKRRMSSERRVFLLDCLRSATSRAVRAEGERERRSSERHEALAP